MRFGKILPIVNLQNKLTGLRTPNVQVDQDLSQRLQSYLQLPATEGLLPFKFILPCKRADNLGDVDYLKSHSHRFSLLVPVTEENYVNWHQSDHASSLDIIWQLLNTADILRVQESANAVYAGSSHFLKQAEMQLFIFKQKGAKLWMLDCEDAHSMRLTENLELDWLPDLGLRSRCNTTQADTAVTRTRLLRLLGLVVNDADTHEIEALFKQDTHLSYQLLKLVSSAAFAQTVEIQSFRQAISLLGRSQLQRWLQLLLYTNPGANINAINPLLPRAAFRARLMENFISMLNPSRQLADLAYMVGIFSLLDKLLAMPMLDLIQPLHLHKDVVDALLHRRGWLGQALAMVELCDDTRSAEFDMSQEFSGAISNQSIFDNCVLDAYAFVAKICAEF